MIRKIEIILTDDGKTEKTEIELFGMKFHEAIGAIKHAEKIILNHLTKTPVTHIEMEAPE